jgi:DNA-binding NtrC family response regulator
MVPLPLPPTISLHVVILDDDEDIAALIALVCQLRRHSVSVAHDVSTARQAIDHRAPDVFIADFHIGLELSDELLEVVHDALPGVRCLLVSGADPAEWNHLVAHGVVRAALRKPFDPIELIALVER